MSYNITIRFLYTITAIIIGTFICFYYIGTSYSKITYYYNNYNAKTTGYITTKKCLNDTQANDNIYDFKCYYIEYTVNGVKYSKHLNQSIDVITNKKVNILYKKDSPEISMVEDQSYLNNFIIIFISLIILILLWLFLLIIILNENSYYNNYLHLFYAFALSIFLSYYCIMNNYYSYYNIIGNYINYDSYTIGIVKDKDTIEYSINNVNKTLKYSTSLYDFKVGDKVNLLYNKKDIEDIIIYDFKSKIMYIVKIILLIICLLLIWFFLIYNISYILQ